LEVRRDDSADSFDDNVDTFDESSADTFDDSADRSDDSKGKADEILLTAGLQTALPPRAHSIQTRCTKATPSAEDKYHAEAGKKRSPSGMLAGTGLLATLFAMAIPILLSHDVVLWL
jgi:hypothetical protein